MKSLRFLKQKKKSKYTQARGTHVPSLHWKAVDTHGSMDRKVKKKFKKGSKILLE